MNITHDNISINHLEGTNSNLQIKLAADILQVLLYLGHNLML